MLTYKNIVYKRTLMKGDAEADCKSNEKLTVLSVDRSMHNMNIEDRQLLESV